MSCFQRFFVLSVLAGLSFAALVCSPCPADDSILITVGPRIGFSDKPLMLGRQQKYSFRLYDIAELWRLSWELPLGDSDRKRETRLITRAEGLEGGGDTGLIATLVPDLALSTWKGLVSLNVGAGLGLFPGTNLARKTSAVRCKLSQPRGSGSTPWLMRMRVFMPSISPTPESTGQTSSV